MRQNNKSGICPTVSSVLSLTEEAGHQLCFRVPFNFLLAATSIGSFPAGLLKHVILPEQLSQATVLPLLVPHNYMFHVGELDGPPLVTCCCLNKMGSSSATRIARDAPSRARHFKLTL